MRRRGTLVNEAEWLRSSEPAPMLALLEGKVSERKLRLVAVACCRRAWPNIAELTSRIAVEVAERHADGTASDEELQNAYSNARQAADETNPMRPGQPMRDWDDPLTNQAQAVHYLASACACAAYPPGLAFAAAIEAESDVALGVAMTQQHREGHANEESAIADLVRDIFGNPLRPALTVYPAWLTWQGGTVAKLAVAAYDERRLPEGTLDPARLAVLADALEDAGCADAELLAHLRGPVIHVRGCWAVDLLLGKG